MTTGTIIDAAERADPLPWWRRPRKRYSALEIASAGLEECRREQLHHAHMKEHHTGMLAIESKRELRLIADIARFSSVKNSTSAPVDEQQD